VAKRLDGSKMKLGMEVGLVPCHILIVLDGDPGPPAAPPKGHSRPLQPMSIVAKRSPISVTAEHLFAIRDAFVLVRDVCALLRMDKLVITDHCSGSGRAIAP